MLLPKHTRHLFLLAFFMLSVFRGNTYAAIPEKTTQAKEIISADVVLESKGIIEAAPEICNGGSFQQNLHKLKHSFGQDSYFCLRYKATRSLIFCSRLFQAEAIKIPLFLFNRRILL